MWECILCSALNSEDKEYIREASCCISCGSTWRARAVTLATITGLGYEPKPMSTIKSDWSRVGLGISDDIDVASRLSNKFFYNNTYFDTFPNLDIRNVPDIAKAKFEFVICSDVLEHIDTDLELAVRGLKDLLNRNGFAVISVPISAEAGHPEFYPELKSFSIKDEVVSWVDKNNISHEDFNPEFHGGRGQNLAFRRFSDESIEELIMRNGFLAITKLSFCPSLGVPEIPFPGIYLAELQGLDA